MERQKVLLFFIIILSLNLAACTYQQAEEDKKVLSVCLGGDPMHFNTNVGDTKWGGYPAANVLSCLIGRDDNNNYVMDLAEGWSISEDGRKYTFQLNRGVKWHDGVVFTSDDVKWTFDTIIKKKGVMVDCLKSVSDIQCPGYNTVIFELKEPDSSFLSVLPLVHILPKHIYENTDWVTNPANQNPVGTGPFKMEEYIRGISVTLKANDDYFKGRPQVDKIVYRVIPDENAAVQAFINGEVDMLDYCSAVSPASIPELEVMKGVKVVKTVSTSRQYMAFNLKKYPMNMLAIRQAVALTIDRDDIIEKAHKGYAQKAEGFYTPIIDWAYNDEAILPKRDVEKAKLLLDKVGFIQGKEGEGTRTRKLDLVTFQYPVYLDIAKIIQENLKEIGIEVRITIIEYAAWFEKVKKGDFDIAILGGDYGSDPNGLSVRIGSNGFMNIMGYSNETVDLLLERGKSTFKQDERAEIYKEIQNIMSEKLPLIPLSEYTCIVVTRDYISGHPVDDALGKVPSAQYSLIRIEK